MFKKIKFFIKLNIFKYIKSNDIAAFISQSGFKSPKILDIGCGNNSPFYIKNLIPGCFYDGVDIVRPNKKYFSKNDFFFEFNKSNFTKGISKLPDCKYDLIIMKHIIEHRKDRDKLLEITISKLKKNGLLYLSYPSYESMYFPHRKGCLNYYDDPTHVGAPPNSEEIYNFFNNKKIKILKYIRNDKPLFFFVLGLILEPLSILLKKKLYGTWQFYGFETIFIIKK